MNKEKLIQLDALNYSIKEAKLALKEKQKLFDEENNSIIRTIEKYSEKIDELKIDFRVEALEQYKKHNIKRFDCGIGIRVSKVLDYDSDLAFNWAKEKDLCLQLDKKQFEGFAKSGNLDFVKTEEKITVTFPAKIKVDKDE